MKTIDERELQKKTTKENNKHERELQKKNNKGKTNKGRKE